MLIWALKPLSCILLYVKNLQRLILDKRIYTVYFQSVSAFLNNGQQQNPPIMRSHIYILGLQQLIYRFNRCSVWVYCNIYYENLVDHVSAGPWCQTSVISIFGKMWPHLSHILNNQPCLCISLVKDDQSWSHAKELEFRVWIEGLVLSSKQ